MQTSFSLVLIQKRSDTHGAHQSETGQQSIEAHKVKPGQSRLFALQWSPGHSYHTEPHSGEVPGNVAHLVYGAPGIRSTRRPGLTPEIHRASNTELAAPVGRWACRGPVPGSAKAPEERVWAPTLRLCGKHRAGKSFATRAFRSMHAYLVRKQLISVGEDASELRPRGLEFR